MIGRMRPMGQKRPLLWIALSVLVASGAAQEKPPPEKPAPQEHHDPAAAPLEAGKRALGAGKRGEAVHHLEAALEFAPDSTEILGLLLDATVDQADAHTFWSHALATAAVASNGNVEGEPKKRLPADDPRPLQLAAARVAAIDDLLKLAREKESEGGHSVEALLVSQWARRVALDLSRSSPQVITAHAAELSPRLTLAQGLPEKVVKLLEAFATNSIANAKTADAIKAARILAGLAVEAGWGKDLQGPKPSGMSGLGQRASALLAKARAQLGNKSEKPWSVDELLQLDGDQAEEFTREHSTFANPGVALSSPKSWYRIETDCGFETLLGVAQTIEQHHQRLANWYGQDPFVNRPGLARIVPEASGLESEGAPYWWAGGFQGGDVTTVRFSCGTIEGLGHGLTHELTHRFDGAIYPGMPSWLMEGRAVWTGGAYGKAADEHFVENWASLGTIEHAFIKGYGDARNLTKLIEGTIDDYRDNYFAGYALYVYLNTRKSLTGKKLFHDRLQKFMKEAHSTRNWKEKFTECFCDKREERPKDFDGFVADWATWLADFYWQARKMPWTKEFVEDPGHVDSPLVMDEPTWVWTRARAEPRFGQEQAALAGDLFLDAGRRADAIQALAWALAVDGRRPASEARLADALTAEGKPDSAWCLRGQIEFPYGERIGAPPFAPAIARTRTFVDLLDGAAADALTRNLPATAAALRAERERLASWLGVERKESGAPVDVAKIPCVFDGASRPLAANGWTESGLTDYEERRAKGRWYVDDNGNLNVGREKPRTATGSVDRAAAQVDCFALAPDWILPGTWRLDARIRFTTSFVNAAVIFGYTEREENLRFGFSAGDFMYAIGVANKEPEFTNMGWGVSGLRDRDGGLPGSTTGGGFDFGGHASSFELTLLVDGAFVQVYLNGKSVGSYHTVDGAAIEGQIGFATSMGAIEVDRARVTRLERSRLAPSASFALTCFDLFSARSLPPWDCLNRNCVGLARATQGTILLWIAPPEGSTEGKPLDDEARASAQQRMSWDLRELASLVERMKPTQRIVVALPEAIGDKSIADLTAFAHRVLGDGVELLQHRQPFMPDVAVSPQARRWLLFVDSSGIVRARSEMPTGQFAADDPWFRQWVKVFREHGHPKRDLPPVERPKPEKPADGKEGKGGADGKQNGGR